MDGELIYALIGIAIFAVIATITLRTNVPKVINSKEDKKNEIIRGYQIEMYKELTSLKGDNKARIAKKKELLKKYSDELSLNIFFEKSEAREIIFDLADNY